MNDLHARWSSAALVFFAALLGGVRPAQADDASVADVTINGPTVQIYGSGLVHPRCLPGSPASRGNFLRAFLGDTQLQVVAASSNPLSMPPDFVQANLPSGAQQLVEGSYALIILCGPGFDSDDSMQFTVFVSYAEQNIVKETARAEAVEASIAANLSAETGRATGAETTLASSIGAETTRAEGAEGTIATNLSAETARATGAEAGLQASVTTEVSRAMAAEAGLSMSIQSLPSGPTGPQGPAGPAGPPGPVNVYRATQSTITVVKGTGIICSSGGGLADFSDIPGAVVNFSVSGAATLEVDTGGGAYGDQVCAFRVLLDGTPELPCSCTNVLACQGDRIVSGSGFMDWHITTAYSVGGGTHTVSVQAAAIGSTTGSGCTIGGFPGTNAKLRVLVH